MKLTFVDVKKAHLNARCGEDEEKWVDLLEEFSRYGNHARLRRSLYGMRQAASVGNDRESQ